MKDTDKKDSREKVDAALKMIEEGVKDLFSSERYYEYLKAMSRFHGYSINNQILIFSQMKEATYVASFKAWQKMNRHVKKGEKGIKILCPEPRTRTIRVEKKDPDGKTVRAEDGSAVTMEKTVKYTSYHVGYVFDVSQTFGDELPTITSELSFNVKGYNELIKKLLAVSPLPVTFGETGAAYGLCRPGKEIVVREGLPEGQTLKTLIHEIAHAMMHNKGEVPLSRQIKEVEAESVAYTVCSYLGLDTSDYSFGYIAGWSGGKDVKELKESLSRIKEAAGSIIESLQKAEEKTA